MNLKDVKKLIKDKEKTEITRFKGEYYILHICKNNTPIPIFHSKNLTEIKDYMEMLNESA
jgi:hypothetical protein